MTSMPNRWIADMTASTALPRDNGELVFQAPWQGRAFALALALNQGGFFQWSDFVDALAANIAAADQESIPSSYYDLWLASLEGLVISTGIVAPVEMDGRTDEFRSGLREEEVY